MNAFSFLKTKHCFSVSFLIILCLSLFGCSSAAAAKQSSPSSSSNNQTAITNSIDLSIIADSDIKDYKWIDDSNPPFQEISFIDSIRFFTEKGSGILYYGRTNCPYCERAIPQLDKAAKELGVRIYYIDVNKSIADTQNESDKYIAALSSYLKSTFSKDENGDPAFYVPEAVGIKNGKITDYMVGLPLDYKMTDNNQMNGNQKKELYSKYKEIILKTAD